MAFLGGLLLVMAATLASLSCESKQLTYTLLSRASRRSRGGCSALHGQHEGSCRGGHRPSRAVARHPHGGELYNWNWKSQASLMLTVAAGHLCYTSMWSIARRNAACGDGGCHRRSKYARMLRGSSGHLAVSTAVCGVLGVAGFVALHAGLPVRSESRVSSWQDAVALARRERVSPRS